MKKIISLLLALILMCTMMICTPITAMAESLYIRKIVSVVYDDSGSMKGDKWAYANYAMQSFCGMLNSDDQLFITYMSRAIKDKNYTPEKVDLSAGRIQDSVDTIREHSETDSTPYTAVEKAYEKLKNVDDSNPNTQYWLVVITDGAFDELSTVSDDKEKKRQLNTKFKEYAKSEMKNGTNPQITFLGIGEVVSPDEDPSKGIYTYSASDANEIISEMSKMADRVSGRTRLDKKDIKKMDDKTIQVSSSIPLLNIAVFAHGSEARVTKAVYSNEIDIPISRNASLSYPNYPDLVGGAFLLGDSQAAMGSGTYEITFDQNVDLEDVVILFEPALEMRMSISLNGQQISDYSELDNSMEGDKVSVSCKLYEMGTDTEISPDLMPPNTKFEISVLENGKQAKKVSGEKMTLSDYKLKNTETEIVAATIIEGFNPIKYTVKFTPVKYVPKITYTIEPSFGGDGKNVKLDNIANNKEMTVCFTVLADGVAITDKKAVEALKPKIEVSPQGNAGVTTYSDDGKIVFTPNAAGIAPSGAGSFNVEVKCTIEDGTTASEIYTVLLADYKVTSVGTKETVKKTKWFGNKVSTSFFITKDGVKLDKNAVKDNISVELNKEHKSLKTKVDVADDGTITITPYSEKQHKLTFFSWWTNWAYYFGLEGKDLTLTMNHPLGTAESTIDVIGEGALYQIFNVYLPLALKIIALAFLITWIVLVVTKPRYLKNATLYVGTIRYNSDAGTHVIRDFSPVKLAKYNKIKKGNGRLKFKKKADVVSAHGMKIRADHGGRIICEMAMAKSSPWYKSRLEPVNTDFEDITTPAEVAEYISKHKRLEIKEFSTTTTVSSEYERILTPANPRIGKYIVVPDSGNGVTKIDERKVIRSGKIFIYING